MNDKRMGYDAKEKCIRNLAEARIFDPTKVVKS
jgi:hypothetical protein